MKQKCIFACLLLVSIGLFSCSQDEEVFSCDKEVNALVKKNLPDIWEMARNEWLNLDESVNRAAYAVFTPEQKWFFWQGKMLEVLDLDWNRAEKKHIELLYETLSDNPQWFAADFSKKEGEYEKVELFSYQWIENAKVHLGWDDVIIGAIVASGNKMLNTEGELLIRDSATTIRLKGNKEVVKKTCDCNVSANVCFPKGCLYKNSSNCQETKSDCGPFWIFPCNGFCTPIF